MVTRAILACNKNSTCNHSFIYIYYTIPSRIYKVPFIAQYTDHRSKVYYITPFWRIAAMAVCYGSTDRLEDTVVVAVSNKALSFSRKIFVSCVSQVSILDYG